MLIKISVENFKSFDKKEELSMLSSSKIQTNKSFKNWYMIFSHCVISKFSFQNQLNAPNHQILLFFHVC